MCVSIFAGRIADTGRDPCPFVAYTVDRTRKPDLILSHVLWASTREVLNVHQADKAGADIVTVSEVLFDRYCRSLDYPLQFVSQDTVIQFHQDGQRAGLIL